MTLPAEVVEELKLRKGQEVDVSVHPVTGAVIIRSGVKLSDDGEVTLRLRGEVEGLLKRRATLYKILAK